jgi:hypothetical protein
MVKSTPCTLTLKEPVVACRRNVHDWGEIEQRGVIDQDIDLAGFIGDPIDAGLNRTDFGHVYVYRGASWSNFRGSPFCGAEIDIPDDNSGAFPNVGFRERPPNAARPARDERNFILQSHCRIVPIFCKRGPRFAS